jgi:hypothetical protein
LWLGTALTFFCCAELGDRTQELEGNALSNHREEYMTQYNVLQEHRQKTVENISRMETDIEFAPLALLDQILVSN